MNTYFNINYEFDHDEIHRLIENSEKGYICVADGTVMRYVHQDMNYRKVVNDALFTISDSSWAPVFLKCQSLSRSSTLHGCHKEEKIQNVFHGQ